MTGTRRGCSVPGCTARHKAWALCPAHYARWRRGTLGRHAAPAPIGYRTAHRRVRATHGLASAQRCSDCGGVAAVWCYDGTDADELVDDRGRRYSADPNRYLARCGYCQRRAVVDAKAPRRAARHRLALDGEHAARLYAAGASSRGIAVLMGVSHNTVLRALRARGVAIRPPVAAQRPRRRRRHPVTRRHRTANHHKAPAITPNPIFTNEQAVTSPELIHKTSTPPRTKNQELQTNPQRQSGPTHQRSLGGCRAPCGPAAPEPQDQQDER